MFPLFTQIPIYATSPVISMGRTLLQDLYASEPLAATFLPTTSVSDSTVAPSLSASPPLTTVESAEPAFDQGKAKGILLPPPTADEIARYFSYIHPLKYSQPHEPSPSPFSPPLNGLTLTAYNAGHTVGGTIWHIQHGMESIVYAVDWNQARENVISGASWFGWTGGTGTEVIEQLRKPTALVCSTKGGDKLALPGGRKRRDDLLLSMLRNCFAKGGTALIPTDTSARVLELAYVLEHAWREAASEDGDDRLRNAGLYLAGKKAHGTMRLARSMLEWMDEGIVREFEASGDALSRENQFKQSDVKESDRRLGPFNFQHLKVIERKSKLDRIVGSQKPKVILTSDTSFDWGYSRHVLQQMASNPNNLIIMTEPLPSDPERSGMNEHLFRTRIGYDIWRMYEQRANGVIMEPAKDGEQLEQVRTGTEITIADVEKTRLEPSDHMIYQQYLATQQQLQRTSQTRGETTTNNHADMLDDASSSSSSEDSDSEQQGRVLNFSASLAHSNKSKLAVSDADLGVNILIRRKGVYDYDVRGKKGRDRMFPYVPHRRRRDEYGEFIRPEEYLRAEERDESEVQPSRAADGRINTKLGQKRRFGDIGTEGRGDGSKKRRSQTDLPAGTLAVGFSPRGGEDESSESEEERESQGVEGPGRAALKSTTVTLNARIAFVDFTGLHDKRSLEMLIPLIQPRKLILVGGMREETLALATECKKLLAVKAGIDISASAKSPVDIFTPSLGETVDASVDTNAWMVKLSKTLARRLKWQNVRNLGVVALTGQLRPPEPVAAEDEAEGAHKRQKMAKVGGGGDMPTLPEPSGSLMPQKESFPLLDMLPINMTAATRSLSRPLHVGDLRLADLRRHMQAAGHKAEFRGEGTLLVDDCVAVRKAGTGKIEIEGGVASLAGGGMQPAGSFLAVKSKIYDSLAVVSGG